MHDVPWVERRTKTGTCCEFRRTRVSRELPRLHTMAELADGKAAISEFFRNSLCDCARARLDQKQKAVLSSLCNPRVNVLFHILGIETSEEEKVK